MKVGYLAVYRDGTGYGNAALNTMLALDKAGVEIAARPIVLTPNPTQIPNAILEMEKRSLSKSDVIIQHILPSMFEYVRGTKHVGNFYWETDSFAETGWQHSCNMMNACIASCLQTRLAIIKSGVTVPIYELPTPIDMDKNRNVDPLKISEARHRCVFYCIAEYTKRKNITALLRSYYSEFSSDDNVLLIIKTNVLGMNAGQGLQHMIGLANSIKSMTKNKVVSKYPPVLFITDRLSDEKLASLHALGDVFVLPSHGESWCVPAAEAMAHGNPVIVSNWGSFPEIMFEQAKEYFVPNLNTFLCPGSIDCGWLINGQLTNCFGQENAGPGMYTGNQQWYDPSLVSISHSMRQAYVAWELGNLKAFGEAARSRIQKFGYDIVGPKIKETLEQIVG